MPVFRARYRGQCAKCGQVIEPGTFISWSKRTRGTVYHSTCVDGGQANPATPADLASATPTSVEPSEPTQAQTFEPATSANGTDEQRVRSIAREIAQEEDASHVASLLSAVEDRLARTVPQTLTVNVRTGDKVETVDVQNAHHALKSLIYLLSKRQHTYLFGPPGSGKSTGAVQAAKALNMKYGYVSLNPQTPESRLLGFIDAGGIYRETEFFRCYTAGGVFCIDELDNGHPALLNTLNGMLETDSDGIGRGAFPCGVVERHPDFVCVATGNTNGRGGDKLFPERRALDAAFMERFTFVPWNYDEAMERSVTLSINPTHGAAWLKFVRQVRAYCKDHSVRLWASPRASFKGADLLRDSGWTAEVIADAVLFKGLDTDTRRKVLDACDLPECGA